MHQVPITAVWPKVMWIETLPKDFKGDWCARNGTPELYISGPTTYHSATHSNMIIIPSFRDPLMDKTTSKNCINNMVVKSVTNYDVLVSLVLNLTLIKMSSVYWVGVP